MLLVPTICFQNSIFFTQPYSTHSEAGKAVYVSWDFVLEYCAVMKATGLWAISNFELLIQSVESINLRFIQRWYQLHIFTQLKFGNIGLLTVNLAGIEF